VGGRRSVPGPPVEIAALGFWEQGECEGVIGRPLPTEPRLTSVVSLGPNQMAIYPPHHQRSSYDLGLRKATFCAGCTQFQIRPTAIPSDELRIGLSPAGVLWAYPADVKMPDLREYRSGISGGGGNRTRHGGSACVLVTGPKVPVTWENG